MERKSNIELLRIIAMLLIILHHAIIHGIFGGVWSFPTEESYRIFLNGTFIYEILYFGGKFGVHVFIMITGYFMISSNVSAKSIVKFWLPVFTWSLIFLVLTILGMPSEETVSLTEIVKSIFPIIFNRYWFAQSYLILYLLIPVLNTIHKRLAKEVRLYFMLFLFMFMIIIPTFTTQYLIGDNPVPLFIFLYYIGASVKDYEKWISKRIKIFKIMIPISIILYVLSVLFLNIIGLFLRSETILIHSTIFSSQYSLIELIFSISVFVLFTQMKIPNNRLINRCASSTFGIYLIHDNYFFRSTLWETLININKLLNMNQFIALAKLFIYVTLIFIFCSLIEQLRIRFMQRTTIFMGNKLEQFIKYSMIYLQEYFKKIY